VTLSLTVAVTCVSLAQRECRRQLDGTSVSLPHCSRHWSLSPSPSLPPTAPASLPLSPSLPLPHPGGRSSESGKSGDRSPLHLRSLPSTCDRSPPPAIAPLSTCDRSPPPVIAPLHLRSLPSTCDRSPLHPRSLPSPPAIAPLSTCDRSPIHLRSLPSPPAIAPLHLRSLPSPPAIVGSGYPAVPLLGWQSRLGGRLGLHHRPEPTRAYMPQRTSWTYRVARKVLPCFQGHPSQQE
jgi:hypothetical protein